MRNGPSSARKRNEPKSTTEATSPFASRCAKAHSAMPQSSGWRVTRRMPTAASSRASRSSPPTAVGLGVVTPTIARRNPSSTRTSARPRAPGSGFQSGTNGAARYANTIQTMASRDASENSPRNGPSPICATMRSRRVVPEISTWIPTKNAAARRSEVIAWCEPSRRQRVVPPGDRPADLVRRILLDEVAALHGDLRLVRPAAAELPLRTDENGARVGVHEELRHRRRGQPRTVCLDDCHHIRRLAVDGDLPRPRERRTPALARLMEGPPIHRHLRLPEPSQHRGRQHTLHEDVVLEHHRLAGG